MDKIGYMHQWVTLWNFVIPNNIHIIIIWRLIQTSQLLCYYLVNHRKMKDFDDGIEGMLKVDLVAPTSNQVSNKIEINKT